VNEFKGNLDHYLRDNRGFKSVIVTFSSFEPFALSSLLLAAVLGKLGKLGMDHTFPDYLFYTTTTLLARLFANSRSTSKIS